MSDEKDDEVYEVLLAVVRSLVDRPEDVDIKSIPGDASLTFRVQAHPTDMGKLIGSNGRTARALRVIVGANAARLRRSFSLDIVNRQDSIETTSPVA